MEVPLMLGNDLHLFGQGISTYSDDFCLTPKRAGSGTILMSIIMTRCQTKIQSHHLPDNEGMHYVL